MKTECSIVTDLLPLYVEDMVNAETAQFIKEHLDNCEECKTELSKMSKNIEIPEVGNEVSENKNKEAKPFKRIMKRMNRQFYMLSYSLVIFFVFLGFSWTAGENLLYNSLIMPIVGVFGYCVFGWRAVYKMPILLLVIDTFACLFGLVAMSLYSAFIWTLIYSAFVLVGIAIAFLLHYALRKENENEK